MSEREDGSARSAAFSPSCQCFAPGAKVFLHAGSADGLRGYLLTSPCATSKATSAAESSVTPIFHPSSSPPGRSKAKPTPETHRAQTTTPVTGTGTGCTGNPYKGGRHVPDAAARPADPLIQTATTRGDPQGERKSHWVSLWHRPVQCVAVAGDTSIVAVVFARTPSVKRSAVYPSASFPSVKGDGDTVDNDNSVPEDVPDGRQQVCLFDAATDSFLAELYFRGGAVHALRANRDLLLVAMVDCFHVIELATLRHLRQQSTHKPLNHRGILALSAAKSNAGTASSGAAWTHADGNAHPRPPPLLVYRLAFPMSSNGRGDVCVLAIRVPESACAMSSGSPPPLTSNAPEAEPAATSPSTDTAVRAEKDAAQPAPPLPTTEVVSDVLVIPAHRRAIAALAMDRDGSRLVTASTIGTTVKLLDAVSGALLMEFQRGLLSAFIYAVGITDAGDTVAALSSNGTLHIFRATCTTSDTAASTVATERSRATGRYALPHASRTRANEKRTVRGLSAASWCIEGSLPDAPPCQPSTRKDGAASSWAKSNEKRENSTAPPPPPPRTESPSRLPCSDWQSESLVLPPPSYGVDYQICFTADGSQVWVGQTAGCAANRKRARRGDNEKVTTGDAVSDAHGPTSLLQRFQLGSGRSGAEECFESP